MSEIVADAVTRDRLKSWHTRRAASNEPRVARIRA